MGRAAGIPGPTAPIPAIPTDRFCHTLVRESGRGHMSNFDAHSCDPHKYSEIMCDMPLTMPPPYVVSLSRFGCLTQCWLPDSPVRARYGRIVREPTTVYTIR